MLRIFLPLMFLSYAFRNSVSPDAFCFESREFFAAYADLKRLYYGSQSYEKHENESATDGLR